MLNARKKLVSLAVASAISGAAMLASAPAQALNVSQNNVGQVLLFPYYTAKNGLDTLFSITNTSSKTVAFKIRFREALNSREVRDFNVILSPYDHWGGVVTASGTSGAAVRTYDNTCTVPNKPSWTAVDVNGDGKTDGYEISFSNALFSNEYADGVAAADNVTRTQEGYFEVIQMGVNSTATNTIYKNALHNSAGVPANCAAVDVAYAAGDWTGWGAPENVLKGHVTYISVATGKAIDAEPTALEDFQTGGHLMYQPASVSPDLTNHDVLPPVYQLSDGMLFNNNVANTVTNADPVSFALAATSVINEWASGGTTNTSWVVTFPTKHHYTDSYAVPGGTVFSTVALPQAGKVPFTEWFPDYGMSCDNYNLMFWNREEKGLQATTSDFSPSPPNIASLCYEANVLDFNGSTIFGTGVNHTGIKTTDVGSNGWAKLSFVGANALTGLSGTVNTAIGLPTIGFAAIMRDGAASVSYGSSIAHTYESFFTTP